MNTWDDFENEARLVEQETNRQEPGVVLLLKESIGLFADAFSFANSHDVSDVTLAKKSLLCHNFATLKCAVDLSLRGYYSQSLNLMRIVYENWIAYEYLLKNPDKADLWLKASKKKQPPGHAAMLKGLGDELKSLERQMKGWYSTFCGFAHTSPLNLLHQISTTTVPDEYSIHFGSTFKGDLFKTTAYSICIWTGVMISTISAWVPETNQWHNEMIIIMERIGYFIDQENSSAHFSKLPEWHKEKPHP